MTPASAPAVRAASPRLQRSRTLPRLAGALANAAFEAHPDAQIVITPRGEVVGANQAGRALIARQQPFRLVGDQLVAGSSWPRLAAQVAEAVREQRKAGGIELSTESGSRLTLCCVPLGVASGAALLVARELPPAPRSGALEAYRLTPAEERVAERLASGLCVGEIAKQLGITVETVRCHLKRTYSKTGVHRQVELVSLLLGR